MKETPWISCAAGLASAAVLFGMAGASAVADPKVTFLVGGKDNVYIADDLNGLIRKYDPRTQLVSTVLGRGKSVPPLNLRHPHGVCFEKGKLHIIDTGNDRVLRVDGE